MLSRTSHTNDTAAATAPAAAGRHLHDLAPITNMLRLEKEYWIPVPITNMLRLLQKLLLRGVPSKIVNGSTGTVRGS